MERSITDILVNGVGDEELWYDWFCNRRSLANKTKALMAKVRKIVKLNNNKKFKNNECYVFFKNNCPCYGHLYDDFRICNIENGDVVYTVIPKSGCNCDNGNAQLWGAENNFSVPLVDGTWKEVCEYFSK